MKFKFVHVIILLSIVFTYPSFSQNFLELKYPELLEPDAELIESGYNYTVERVNNRKFIFKGYWDDIPDIAIYKTYDSHDFSSLHGPYAVYNEDGTVSSKGEFYLGDKNGPWQEGKAKGNYHKGHKTGEWKSFNKENKLIKIENYDDGTLNGEVIDYDTSGKVINKVTYEYGEITEGNPLSESKIFGATFPGCDRTIMDDTTFTKCSNDLMYEYFDKKIKYPFKARNQGLQGLVVVRFTIDDDGEIKDVIPVKPAPDVFITLVINALLEMPRFNPALLKGKPVKQWVTLPCPFRLDGGGETAPFPSFRR